MWQLYVAVFICPCRWLGKYLLLIYVSNNFAQRRCPLKGKNVHLQDVLEEAAMLDAQMLGTLETGFYRGRKKNCHILCSVSSTRAIFYVAIFICHKKTNAPAFQHMQLSYKNWQFFYHLHGQIKIAT